MADQNGNDGRNGPSRAREAADGPGPTRRGDSGEESSGSGALDAVNDAARNVLGDAEVDYDAEVGYRRADEEEIQELAAQHGDVITRNPDGTHTVTARPDD